MLIFTNIVLENFNVLISKKVLILQLSTSLCLFLTKFVLLSRNKNDYKVFTLCPKKRGRFLVKDQVKVFF